MRRLRSLFSVGVFAPVALLDVRFQWLGLEGCGTIVRVLCEVVVVVVVVSIKTGYTGDYISACVSLEIKERGLLRGQVVVVKFRKRTLSHVAKG